MSWVRDGQVPDEIKVSFVVKTADHPELAAWLWRLPFRKASSIVRNVLSGAAIQIVSKGPIGNDAHYSHEQAYQLASEGTQPSSGPVAQETSSHALEPTDKQSPTQVDVTAMEEEMTAEAAVLLREMDDQFK